MGARGFFRFAEYALSDGCWPPSLATVLISILIATMIGSQETECKGLHAVDISLLGATHDPLGLRKEQQRLRRGAPLWFDHELFLGEEIQVVLAAGAGIDDSGKVARKIVGVSAEGNAEGEGNF
jgi:hypothetical protein